MEIWAWVKGKVFGFGVAERRYRRALRHQPRPATAQELLELQERLAQAELEAKRIAARRLMQSRQYDECIRAWRAIQQQHPEHHAHCEAAIARVLLRMRRTDEAIARLEAARRGGANPQQVERGLELARIVLGERGAFAS